MDTMPDPTETDAPFTRADYDAFAAATLTVRALERKFKRFVLERFAAYTRVSEVFDLSGTRVEPLGDGTANAGWVIPEAWSMSLSPRYEGKDKGQFVPVAQYRAIDGVRSVANGIGRMVKVPLAFIFGDDEDYARYLALKAIFEPNAAPSTAPEEDLS